MKALKLYGKEDLRLEEVEEPKLDTDGAILKIAATSICATDIKAYVTGARTKLPIILGHEFSGIITEASKEYEEYLSKKVVVNPDIFCGSCEFCLNGEHTLCDNLYSIGLDVDGSFTELVKIPAQAFRVGNVQEIPEDLSFEEACLIEPFASCLRGQDKLNIKSGDIVTIMGAGPIGLMHLKLAQLSGARKIIVVEPLENRRRIAKTMGADHTISPVDVDLKKEILELTDKLGSDVVIVAVPSPEAQIEALNIVAKGGRINYFAGLPSGKEIVSINSNIIHYKQVTLTGTSMPAPKDFLRMLRIVKSKKLDVRPFITHMYPLDKGIQAFTTVLKSESLKVVMHP